jgi:streptogramin lyase
MSHRVAWVVVVVAIVCASGGACPARAELNHGDIVFSQDDAGQGPHNAVLKYVPSTGERIVISQPTVRGAGPDFGSLIGGLTLDGHGGILLTGFEAASVFRIDPDTGDRSILTGPGVGNGPAIEGPNDVILGPQGSAIYVSAGTSHSIVRVDPQTGDRTLISGPSRGTGAFLDHPAGLARTANGDFYTFDADTEAVFFVDGVTGDRRIVSGAGVGGGPQFNGFGFDVVVLPDGMLAVSDHDPRILRVDPNTGNRSILTGEGVGSGPNTDFLEYLTVTADGKLLASAASDGILSIDPLTGDRTLIVGGDVGSGFATGLFREAVETAPEPSGVLVLGGIVVAHMLRVRRGAARHGTRRHVTRAPD